MAESRVTSAPEREGVRTEVFHASLEAGDCGKGRKKRLRGFVLFWCSTSISTNGLPWQPAGEREPRGAGQRWSPLPRAG